MEAKQKRNTENVRQSSIFFYSVHRLFCYAYLHPPWQHWRSEGGLILLRSIKSDNCTYWVRFHKEGIFSNFHFPKSWCYTYQNMILIFPAQVSWTTPADVQALWKGFLIPIITYLHLWRNQNLVLYQTTRTLRKKSSQSHLQVFGEEFWANCIIDVSHRFKSRQPHKISFNPNFLQLRR